jgi:hypothetical protein
MKEVSESLRIIKVINEHLAEQPECKHDLKTIMRQAIEMISKNGLRPTTTSAPTDADDHSGINRNDQEIIQ